MPGTFVPFCFINKKGRLQGNNFQWESVLKYAAAEVEAKRRPMERRVIQFLGDAPARNMSGLVAHTLSG